MTEIVNKAKKIKCLICDVDGVLTDGLLHIDNFANELKTFHVHDGFGLKLLMSAGIEVGIITTSKNAVVNFRMEQLGIKHYFVGQLEKETAYLELKNRLGLSDEDFAYIGDDLPDLSIIQKVGLGVAVANAQPLVKEYALWETRKMGGNGAVRELCDLILNSQGKMEIALKSYLGK